jgi:hypothetical protein
MGFGPGFFRNEVLSAPEFNKFTVLGDPEFELSIFQDLTVRNEFITPKFPIFSAPYLSSLETYPYRCARLIDFAGRCVLG